MKYPTHSKQQGFTLIELLIVTALVITLGALSAVFYSRFFTQNAVANAVDQLTGELRKAQIYAMMGKQNSNWGVRYGNNQITLFQGNSYSTRNSSFDESFAVNSNIAISGFSEIMFTRMTGTPSAMPLITVSGAGNTESMNINTMGVVSR